MASTGLKVCLLEKGKEWGPGDFGKTSSSSFPNLRFQAGGILGGMGSQDSLYDVRLDGDVIVFQASGLGGGSLINTAIAIRPTPQVEFEWLHEYQLNNGKVWIYGCLPRQNTR